MQLGVAVSGCQNLGGWSLVGSSMAVVLRPLVADSAHTSLIIPGISWLVTTRWSKTRHDSRDLLRVE